MELMGPLQLQVMHIIWKVGPQTVQQVATTLNAKRPEKPLAYTTFLTVMRNLARRKFCEQVKEGGGRAHTFKALISAEDYKRQLVGDVLTNAFQGDWGGLCAIATELGVTLAGGAGNGG